MTATTDEARPAAEAAPLVAPGGDLGDYLQLVAEISRDFAASLDAVQTLKNALVRIVQLTNSEAASIFMLEDNDATLACRACVGPVDIVGLRLKATEGLVGKCVSDNAPVVIRDARTHPNFQRRVDATTGFVTRSVLSAPLSVKDTKVGAIQVINKASGDGLFDDSDLRLLQALAGAAALAIINNRMAAALVEQERTKRELELAAMIQRNLLPPDREKPFPICGVSRPALSMSGDFYDFFPLPDGKIAFNLGDVSGKGMNAAMMMAKTCSLYRCLGKRIAQPGRALGAVNAEVAETATMGMFVTVVGGVFDPATGRITLANAGHEPSLIVHRDGRIEEIGADSPPIGILADLGEDGVPEISFDLGDSTLYLFTDGVTEGLAANGEMLTRDGVLEIVRRMIDHPLEERLAALADAVTVPGQKQHDDVTILAVEAQRR